MLETGVEEGMSGSSAAVVEHLGGVDNLAHYGRSLGLIEGLLKVPVVHAVGIKQRPNQARIVVGPSNSGGVKYRDFDICLYCRSINRAVK